MSPGHRVERADHLDLFVAHRIGFEARRRLHRDQAQKLHQWFCTMSRIAPEPS
jgi:hypothetical protein